MYKLIRRRLVGKSVSDAPSANTIDGGIIIGALIVAGVAIWLLAK
jgi:hypothetical protein